MLISDGLLLPALASAKIGNLRHIFSIRAPFVGAAPFSDLLKASSAALPAPESSPQSTLAALPYSSGTTGLPKGVMLSHYNLVSNVYQLFAPGEEATPTSDDITLDFLPLYHIYGLNVVLNPTLMSGGTLVMMPRFNPERALALLTSEGITLLPLVPPVMSCFITAAEQSQFPANHQVRACKS